MLILIQAGGYLAYLFNKADPNREKEVILSEIIYEMIGGFSDILVCCVILCIVDESDQIEIIND